MEINKLEVDSVTMAYREIVQGMLMKVKPAGLLMLGTVVIIMLLVVTILVGTLMMVGGIGLLGPGVKVDSDTVNGSVGLERGDAPARLLLTKGARILDGALTTLLFRIKCSGISSDDE
jgi:hypothetical protein